MPLRIDISDVTLEKTEHVHRLHVWGARTSLWATNCIVCGKDTNGEKTRCPCGDDFSCCTRCLADGQGERLADYCSRITPLHFKDRPGPNHRRVMIFQGEPPLSQLVWAEVKDSHLVIDHPSLDAYYKPRRGVKRPWVDLAVINPGMDSESFRKIGHGICMGFSSAMMDNRHTADPSELNKALFAIEHLGGKAQWPGPVFFFSYGYDMSDYIKVDPKQTGGELRGAETSMTELDIWNEMEALRWGTHPGGEEGRKKVPRKKKRTTPSSKAAAQLDGLEWMWKIKDPGTSMEILDVHHRDLMIIAEYMLGSQMNPIPYDLVNAHATVRAIQIMDLSHPMFKLVDDFFWGRSTTGQPSASDTPSTAEPPSASNTPPTDEPPSGPNTPPINEPPSAAMVTKPEDLMFDTVNIPCDAPGFNPMLGAFAVGLRWTIRYSMVINPPFRGNIPETKLHGPMQNLLWTAKFPPPPESQSPPQEDDDPNKPKPPTTTTQGLLKLHAPGPTCDSVIVVHADKITVLESQVLALLKYLDFTDPMQWSRHGPRGFEAYWKMYAKIELEAKDADEIFKMSPYTAEETSRVVMERSSSRTGDKRVVEFERELAHLTLEGLTGEDLGRKGEIEANRRRMLKMVKGHREMGLKFVVGPGVVGCST